MENFNNFSNQNETLNSSKLINRNSNIIPIYTSSFSCQSNWSYLSNSSVFENQADAHDLSLDFDPSNNDNQTHHYLNQSLPTHILNQFNNNNNNNNNYYNNNGQQFFIGGSTHSLDSLMESDVSPFFNTTNSLESVIPSHNQTNQFLKDVNIEDSNEENKPNDLCGGQMHMWQFLLELLEDKHCRNLIRWISFDKNNHDNEFVIYDPVEIVRRWGVRHAKPNMNYKKFCRTLRYYYKKKILQKTAGKPHTYHFQINIQPYLSQLHWQQQHLIFQHPSSYNSNQHSLNNSIFQF